MLATGRPWSTRSLASSLLCAPLRRHWNRDEGLSRALETYTTSCCFRLVVRRLEGEPELQRRASLGFGQGMMLLLFGCGVLAFVLVETHAIACSLPGGGGVDPERKGGGLGGRGEGTF
jgi:hypothetical protein